MFPLNDMSAESSSKAELPVASVSSNCFSTKANIENGLHVYLKSCYGAVFSVKGLLKLYHYRELNGISMKYGVG